MPVYGERSKGRGGRKPSGSAKSSTVTPFFIKWPFNIIVPTVSYSPIPVGVNPNPDTLPGVNLDDGFNVLFNFSGVVNTNYGQLALAPIAAAGIYFEGKAELFRADGSTEGLFWRLEPFQLIGAQNYQNAPVSTTNPGAGSEDGVALLYSMLNVPQASCFTYLGPGGQPFDGILYPGDRIVIYNPRIKTNNPPVQAQSASGQQLQSTGGPNIVIDFD